MRYKDITDEAREALMDNRIPQTAAVKRGSARLRVTYDGSPKFKPIDGTGMGARAFSCQAVALALRAWLDRPPIPVRA